MPHADDSSESAAGQTSASGSDDQIELEVPNNSPDVPYEPPDPLTPRAAQGEICSGFEPYYRRYLEGDPEALVDYYIEQYRDTSGTELGSAFYECLGWLVLSPLPEHTKIVKRIMVINDRGGPLEQEPARFADYEIVRKNLKHAAKETYLWIQDTRKSNEEISLGDTIESSRPTFLSREKLWIIYQERYIGNKVPKELFWLLAEKGAFPSVAIRNYASSQAGIAQGTATRRSCAKKR